MGTFVISAKLTDTQLSTSFKLLIEVINDPPDFEIELTDQTFQLGKLSYYKLPEAKDFEGMDFSIKLQLSDGMKVPNFIRLEKKSGIITFDVPDD